MIKITFSEESWEYVVTLNGCRYTACDSFYDAETEAKNLLHDLRYGR